MSCRHCYARLHYLAVELTCGRGFGDNLVRGHVAIVVAWVVLLLGSPALAGVSTRTVSLDSGGTVVLIEGEFEFRDDPLELAKAVLLSGAKVVTFNSNGGNVHAAMQYGRAIRRLGLRTVQIRSAQCASACALAFVGGQSRAAEPGSIGVHRSSFSDDAGLDGQSAVAAVQAVTAEILTYLIEMGVDPKLLQLSLSTDSSDMRYLTSSEMTQLQVTLLQSIEANDSRVAETRAPSQQPSSSSDFGSGDDDGAKAIEFIAKYHEAWSGPANKAMGFMQSAYADNVAFYGKILTRDEVLKDKATFLDRWPKRAYSVRHGSERFACGLTCSGSAIVEWFAFSPKRAKTSSGSAEISIVWNPRTGKIETENSKVLETDRGQKGPDRIIAQWQRQNGTCRGNSGDDPDTMKACDRREVVGAALQSVGWCYGREGEYGYQMDWHRCGR